MSRDENDRLKDGTLPQDPFSDTEKVSDEVPRILTVKELILGAGDRALSGKKHRGCTTGVHALDEITGGMKPGFVWVFGADTSWGKCLRGDTLVMRSDGSGALAKDIKKGDLLMGPDSRPRRVLSTTCGNGPMYRINMQRGDSWECNWAHVLVVVSTRTGEITEISAEDFCKKSPTWRMQQKMMHTAVEFPERDAPQLDPWLFGVWCGDGTKDLKTTSVTNPDAEVISGMAAVAESYDSTLNQWTTTDRGAHKFGFCKNSGSTNQITAKIRQLHSTEKLPDCYVYGSRDVRLQFLAGIIDTDGYKKGERLCEIVTQYKGWARDLRFLARSLGFAANIYEKTNIPGYEDRVYYRVCITGDLSVVPVRVERKKFSRIDTCRVPTRTGFTVEPIGNGDYYGWQLDGDGLFLLADCTVTHNSSFLCMLTDENIKAGKRVLIVSAEDSEQLYGDRLLIRRSKVSANNFRNGTLNRDEKSSITNVMQKAEDIPVFLDGRGKSVEWITKRVKDIIKEHKIDLVAFDYLQAFDNEKAQQDRRNQVTYISRVLTDVVKTSNATGVIFSQITVQPNKTHPDKHSIRESRDVSNAAEVIVLGFAPEKPIADSKGNILVEAQQKCIFVDKCKDGPRGAVIGMEWNSESACFESIKSKEQARYDEVTGGEFDDLGDPF